MFYCEVAKMLLAIFVLISPFYDASSTPEEILDRINAEASRIRTADCWYEFEVRNLIPRVRLPPKTVLSNEEAEAMKKQQKDVQARMKTDPNLLRKESDPDSRESAGTVHYLHRGRDFLLVREREERAGFFDAAMYPRTYVFGQLGEDTLRYRSRRHYTKPPTVLPLGERYDQAALNEAISHDKIEVEIQHDATPFEILKIFSIQWYTQHFLYTDIGNGAPPLKVEHVYDTSMNGLEKTVTLRSKIKDPRLLSPSMTTTRAFTIGANSCPMPVRITVQNDDRHLTWHVGWAEFKGPDGTQVWFPTSVRREHLMTVAKGGVNANKLSQVDTLKVDTRRTRINFPIPDEALRYPLTPGTFVMDRRSGEEYTVSDQGKSDKTLDDLINQAPPPPTSPWRDHLPTFLGINLTILAVIALVAWFRKRSRLAS